MRLVSGGGNSKRYIGTSGDTKPVSSATEIITPGSTFLEVDTGVMWRHDGNGWSMATAEVAQVEMLAAIHLELRRISMQLTLAYGVDVPDADLS